MTYRFCPISPWYLGDLESTIRCRMRTDSDGNNVWSRKYEAAQYRDLFHSLKYRS